MFRSALVSAVAVLAVATAAPISAQTYYEHVRPVLIENCAGCHSESGIAWSMEDAEETFERARMIARMIDQRRMPPFLAEPGHQRYVGDTTLDEATIRQIRRWADAGYPKGEPRPDPAPERVHMAAPTFRADITLPVLPDEGYLPDQASADDYRCFLVDWPETEDAYVTGFRADPGNRRVGHHVVVSVVDPDMWPRYRELEDEEEGPGYTCFGGSLPTELGEEWTAAYEAEYPGGLSELGESDHWLAHWAPGMDGHTFPAGTGLRVRPGSGLVVQMHYYAGAAPGERDSDTYIDFITRPSVERPAMHLPQTNNDAWFLDRAEAQLVVPVGELRTYEYRDDLVDVLDRIATASGVAVEDVTAIEIHSANLHMHAIGHSGEITLTHPTGEVEVLLSVPRWDLAWQRDFTFVEPKVIEVDDLEGASLAVRCTFENTTDEPVVGGLGSGDEMCFNFSYIAVRTGDSVTTDSGEPRQH